VPRQHHLCPTPLLRRCVVQDTKRILQEEIDVMREEIFRRENTAKYEQERKTAETAGWADLNRLEEQIARLEVKIDRAKQLLYFPPVKGYRYVHPARGAGHEPAPYVPSPRTARACRFTGGSAGVYTAAKDLYISEISGRFLLSCQAVTKRDGSKVARVTIELAGATFGDLSGCASPRPTMHLHATQQNTCHCCPALLSATPDRSGHRHHVCMERMLAAIKQCTACNMSAVKLHM
jgi:hypothetical protein